MSEAEAKELNFYASSFFHPDSFPTCMWKAGDHILHDDKLCASGTHIYQLMIWESNRNKEVFCCKICLRVFNVSKIISLFLPFKTHLIAKLISCSTQVIFKIFFN